MEEHNQATNAIVPLDEWLKTKPQCLKIVDGLQIDLQLTVDPADEQSNGHLFITYDKEDATLFLTMQYDPINKTQVRFAQAVLRKIFNLDLALNKNGKSNEVLFSTMIESLQLLLNEFHLNVDVSDEFETHQEVSLFVK